MAQSKAIALPATVAGILELDTWTEANARLLDLGERQVESLRVCAAEAATNIVTHAMAGRDDGIFEVQLHVNGGARLVFLDDGPAFDPTAVPDPPRATSIQDAPLGGLGIRLIRGFARSMSYRRTAGRNELTLLFDPTSPEGR